MSALCHKRTFLASDLRQRVRRIRSFSAWLLRLMSKTLREQPEACARQPPRQCQPLGQGVRFLRQRVLDETELHYNAMTLGVFQLLAAKRDQIMTARTYVELLRDYWLARNDVERMSAGGTTHELGR